MQRIRTHATYANVIATIALMLSLTGTSMAAGILISGKQVRDNTLTGADIRNSSLASADIKDRSLTARDVKPNSLGTSQIGTLGSADIGSGVLNTGHLASTAKVQLPMISLDRILIGLNNANQPLETVGPFTLSVPANGCVAGQGVTVRLNTSVADAVADGDTDFDPAEAVDAFLDDGGQTSILTATAPTGETYGIIVQGGLVNGGTQCSVGGIIVQGGKTPSAGIIVQGG